MDGQNSIEAILLINDILCINGYQTKEPIQLIVNNNEVLTDDISKYIIDIYVNKINTESKKEITSDDVKILYYFGKYNECHIAIISGDCMAIPENDEYIYDIVFMYKMERISVYKNNKYYYLKEAYDLDMITYEQVLEIYNLYEIYKKQ